MGSQDDERAAGDIADAGVDGVFEVIGARARRLAERVCALTTRSRSIQSLEYCCGIDSDGVC